MASIISFYLYCEDKLITFMDTDTFSNSYIPWGTASCSCVVLRANILLFSPISLVSFVFLREREYWDAGFFLIFFCVDLSTFLNALFLFEKILAID